MIKTILSPVLNNNSSLNDDYVIDEEFINFLSENKIDLFYTGIINNTPTKLSLICKISRFVALFSLFEIVTNEELAMYVKIKFGKFVLSQEEKEYENNN